MRPYSHRKAVRDEQLNAGIPRVHAANHGVYGTRKVWLATAINCRGSATRPALGTTDYRFPGLTGHTWIDSMYT
jgi:hypothetical protein